MASSQVTEDNDPGIQPEDSCSNISAIVNHPHPPPHLERHLIDGVYHIRWNAKDVTDFSTWWTQTSVGRKFLHSKTDGKFHHPQWNSRSRSKIWDDFDQLAEITTGTPKVRCRICGLLFQHPTYTGNGPSSMSKHQKMKRCGNGQNPNGTQVSLDSLTVSNRPSLSSNDLW
jgi:hypothetical protein